MIGKQKRCSARLVTKNDQKMVIIEKGRHHHTIPPPLQLT